jgi:MFS family permease
MIQQPVQPFLIDKLSADDKLQFGFIRSFTGALQVVGSLISGVLIDRIGCKNVLLLSFLASALSYGITAGASDLLSLYVAQVPTLLQHAMLVSGRVRFTHIGPFAHGIFGIYFVYSLQAATAYVAIESHDATTAAHIGFVRVAYGAGAVLGPAVGGQIGKVSLQLGAGIATAGSLVSVALVALFLKDAKANKVPADSAAANDSKPAAAPSKSVFDGFRHIVDSPLLLSLMGIKVLFRSARLLYVCLSRYWP